TNNFLMMKVYQYFRKARENDDALQNNYQNILDGHKELLINRDQERRVPWQSLIKAVSAQHPALAQKQQ
ncbi:hypothetical protein VWN47_10530, partial [Campylobacter jejuni]|uniref:hypothetical protein n=1 Tax=Campylobacter jejuni TaxID=197 RepID=UPI002F340D02